MEITEEAKLNMKNALKGTFSNDYDELQIVLDNLNTKKAAATDHGSFKKIDNTMEKIKLKMSKIKV